MQLAEFSANVSLERKRKNRTSETDRNDVKRKKISSCNSKKQVQKERVVGDAIDRSSPEEHTRRETFEDAAHLVTSKGKRSKSSDRRHQPSQPKTPESSHRNKSERRQSESNDGKKQKLKTPPYASKTNGNEVVKRNFKIPRLTEEAKAAKEAAAKAAKEAAAAEEAKEVAAAKAPKEPPAETNGSGSKDYQFFFSAKSAGLPANLYQNPAPLTKPKSDSNQNYRHVEPVLSTAHQLLHSSQSFDPACCDQTSRVAQVDSLLQPMLATQPFQSVPSSLLLPVQISRCDQTTTGVGETSRPVHGVECYPRGIEMTIDYIMDGLCHVPFSSRDANRAPSTRTK